MSKLTTSRAVSNDVRARRTANEFAALKRTPHEHVDVELENDADSRRWYFRLRNLPGDLAGGEYIGHIRAPADYPTKPPVYMLYTPNGVVAHNTEAVCTSISGYHTEGTRDANGKLTAVGWNPTKMNMVGYLMLLISTLMNWETMGTGLNLLNNNLFVDRTDKPCASRAHFEAAYASIRRAAADSRAFNRTRWPAVTDQFNCDMWSLARSIYARGHWDPATSTA